MKILKFNVQGQTITVDPLYNLNSSVPGTEENVVCKFTFSSEWSNCNKVAAFTSMLGHEYEPRLISRSNECVVPAEALKKRSFKLHIIGKKKDEKFLTNKITITQKGGK